MHFCQITRSITKFGTLTINRKYAFPCRLFPEKDIDILLEVLSQSHSIKTGKI